MPSRSLHPLRLAVALLLVALPFVRAADPPLSPAATGPVEFAKDVKPILQARCVCCHGEAKQKGALRLDTPEGVRAGGASGASVVAGKSAESLLVHHVVGVGEASIMPPKGERLTAAQVGVLRA